MKSLSVIVLALCIHLYDGSRESSTEETGQWSAFSECTCNDVEQTRRKQTICNDNSCIVKVIIDIQPCECADFNFEEECPKVFGVNSVYGILADPCNCNHYVQCMFNSTSNKFYGIHRHCNPCEVWNQELLTCILDTNDQNCSVELTSQMPETCELQEVEGFPNKFLNGDIEIECASGTLFNLTSCVCDIVIQLYNNRAVQNTRKALVEITCLDFENKFMASKGVYVFNNNVEFINDTDQCKSGYCARFHSNMSSVLEIPYFSNAMDQYPSFSLSFFFKSLSPTGTKSLLDNSQCDVNGSLAIYSTSESIGSVVMNSTKETVESSADITDNSIFHHFVLSYDGTTVTTYLDKVLVESEVLGGKIDRVKAPIVIGGTICDGDNFFDGYIDTLVFFNGVLLLEEVEYLNDNPEQCVPTR